MKWKNPHEFSSLISALNWELKQAIHPKPLILGETRSPGRCAAAEFAGIWPGCGGNGAPGSRPEEAAHVLRHGCKCHAQGVARCGSGLPAVRVLGRLEGQKPEDARSRGALEFQAHCGPKLFQLADRRRSAPVLCACVPKRSGAV